MANTYTWDCKTVDTYPTHDSHSDVVYKRALEIKRRERSTRC